MHPALCTRSGALYTGGHAHAQHARTQNAHSAIYRMHKTYPHYTVAVASKMSLNIWSIVCSNSAPCLHAASFIGTARHALWRLCVACARIRVRARSVCVCMQKVRRPQSTKQVYTARAPCVHACSISFACICRCAHGQVLCTSYYVGVCAFSVPLFVPLRMHKKNVRPRRHAHMHVGCMGLHFR